MWINALPSPVHFAEGPSPLLNRVLLPIWLGPTTAIRVPALTSNVTLVGAMYPSSPTLLSQDLVEEGGLARAEGAGEDGDGYFARRVHKESSFKYY